MVNAIITCAGAGLRCGLGKNKILYNIGNVTLLQKTLQPFLAIDDISKIIITCNSLDYNTINSIITTLATTKPIQLCLGGDTRTLSIKNGLACLDNACKYVLIHDGARPFVTTQIIQNCIACAQKFNACAAFIPLVDSIKQIDENNNVVCTPNRKNYVNIQTPQGFEKTSLLKAYASISENDVFTDDCSVYEKYIGKIHLFEGDVCNKKITTKEDLNLFKPNNISFGIGFDTHQLVDGRKLVLGGVDVPHTKGLLGHSDADVLAHAIMDSILSACNMRDIGVYFPDTDAKFKGISSIILLKQVNSLICEKGFKINNISAVIMAQNPKLARFIPQMMQNIANALNIDVSKITISATTTEKLGLVGKEEAISSEAICSCYN
ncbi:MAG: 2-C-methyl-D-erythritol 2,4-cyclodiphosphate synthase [Clostridia bacterium]